ncbi:GNAT family N-acetyltransferase [Litchfieldia alkalitelluris]|uniref:GNAT family N-acetyltransferase n=1 Tax=Litchfieldia alkalitelluris TaxID=304268 RepID=UPI0009983DA9|nr:N-acetyltransferase [Litchfieldia alkalitelluris]
MNYFIRSENEKDYAGIREVNIVAFNKENEAKLIEAIRGSNLFIPELSLVAVSEKQEILGHILFSEIILATEGGEIPTIGLAPMAVKPEYQNMGIGSALVKRGLDLCKTLGYSHVFVLGHPNFYPKFGFAASSLYGIESPFPVPEEVFMAIEIDKDSLSGLQGKIKYPPAFSSVT